MAAAEARRDPARFAAVTAPGGAAVLALLPLRGGERALVVGDRWGRLAIPLARRAAVCALLPSAAEAALLACIAAQEGALLTTCAGALAAPPLADGCFDLVLLLDAVADLRTAAALLAANGCCYATGDSLAALRASADDAGLVPSHEYVCVPDANAPRRIVPLALVDPPPDERADGGGAATPTFALVLRRPAAP
ncbi:MAG: hypothetical protein U0802_14645 [Candidatus Binatia bacterium]